MKWIAPVHFMSLIEILLKCFLILLILRHHRNGFFQVCSLIFSWPCLSLIWKAWFAFERVAFSPPQQDHKELQVLRFWPALQSKKEVDHCFVVGSPLADQWQGSPGWLQCSCVSGFTAPCSITKIFGFHTDRKRNPPKKTIWLINQPPQRSL